MLIAILLDAPTWSEAQDATSWYDRDEKLKALVSGALSYNGVKLTVDNTVPYYIEPQAEKVRTPSGDLLNLTYDHDLISSLLLFDGSTHLFVTEYAKEYLPKDIDFGAIEVLQSPKYDMTVVSWLLNVDKQITATVKAIEPPKIEVIIKTIESVPEMHEAVEACHATGVCCFDLETGGLKYWDKDYPITILAFSPQPGLVYCVPLQHAEAPEYARWTETIMQMFLALLESPNVDKIAHNAKFDVHWLRRYHNVFEYRGRWYDTMLMAHILDENRKVGLKDLTRKLYPEYAGYELKFKTDNEWATAPLHQLVPYAAIDVHLTMMLRIQYEQELLKDDRLYRYFRSMSMPVMWLLEELEYNGMPVNRQYLEESVTWAEANIEQMEFELRTNERYLNYEKHRLTITMAAELEKLKEKQAKHKEGAHYYKQYQTKIDAINRGEFEIEPINFNSPDQVEKFIYSEQGLGLRDMGTTSRNVLKDFNHEWLDLLMAYKQMNKMLGTYYLPILNMIDENDKLHGNLNQSGTRTGRLSSSEPNLQNLPVRTPLKNKTAIEAVKRVKRFFAATDGDVLLGVDMSQAELRTIANVSGDPTMIKAYLEGIDLHTLTASRIYGCSYEDFLKLKVDKPEVFTLYRTMAKGANFGLVYGAGATTYMAYLAQNYGVIINPDEEKIHRAALFGVYRGLKPWHELYEAKLQKFGYVRTLFGRKRNLPDIFVKGNDRDAWLVRSKALRNAINSPIQGTSAEYCLLAMVLIRWRLHNIMKLINNIHDATYGTNKPKHNDFVAAVFGETFTKLPIELLFDIGKDRSPVPMGVDISVGPNWADLQDVKYMPYEEVPW
jgi:DNA polymerase-1